MPRRKLETYSADGVWRNRLDDHEPLPGEYDTRHAAVEAGRDEARIRALEHIIRRTDGTVAERNRYPRLANEIPG